MAVLPIRAFPDPCLKAPNAAVGVLTPPVLQLIDDLIETMRAHRRCVGLAAPQVGRNIRVAVIDVGGHPKATQPSGLMVLVNPQIAAREQPLMQREGCQSIPDLTANVIRANRVQVKAMDRSGHAWTRWLDGFEAIAAQHEVDHLDGKLFLDRIVNLKTDLFRRKTYL